MNEEDKKKVDLDWVKEQMTSARIRRGAGDAVLELLEAWEAITVEDDDMAQEAISVFSKVALGHSLVADDGPEVWVPAQPGQLKVADIVRVKSDAYSGELGQKHNGRRGTITAIRYGDIIVTTNDGKLPQLDGVHYTPYNLEKRVK